MPATVFSPAADTDTSPIMDGSNKPEIASRRAFRGE